jgi:hypothetical protein
VCYVHQLSLYKRSDSAEIPGVPFFPFTSCKNCLSTSYDKGNQKKPASISQPERDRLTREIHVFKTNLNKVLYKFAAMAFKIF